MRTKVLPSIQVTDSATRRRAVRTLESSQMKETSNEKRDNNIHLYGALYQTQSAFGGKVTPRMPLDAHQKHLQIRL